jgi:hypothetical protein
VTGRWHVDGSDDIVTIKLRASDGEPQWQRLIGGGYDDRGWAIGIGPDGNPMVTGILSNGDGTAQFITFKLRGSDGSTVWSRPIPGALDNVTEKIGWLVVCDDGDAIMGNRTWSSTTGYDVILQRYAAADGATVWERQYGSAGTVGDEPRCMVRDRAGDLLVAGARRSDFMALKFSRVDGSLLWSTDYNGPAGSYDAANCVIEGPGGTVVVSGFTSSPIYSWNVSTIGLDPVDGDRMWAAHHDGGGNGQSGEGKILAVGPLDDIYVCGYFYGLTTDSDMMSLRYTLGPPAGVVEDGMSVPVSIYPNPSTSATWISLDLDSTEPVRVVLYDPAGRRGKILHEGVLDPGRYRFSWDDGAAAPGVYLVRIETPRASVVRKLIRLP